MSKSHYIISTEKNIPQSWTVYVHCTVQCAVCAVTSVVNFATPTFFQSPICLGSILSHQKPNLPGLICRGFIKKSITWWSKKVMQKKCRSSKFDLSISSGCRRGGFFQVQGSTPSRGSETIFTSAGNLFQIFAAERVPSTKCLTHVRWCSTVHLF